MRRFLTGLALTALTLVAGLVAIGHLLAVEDPLVDADAIVAISGDAGHRTETAVQLWKARRAPLIIFAGSSLDPASAPSGELMKREAIRLGVPAAQVLVEPSSATTEENAILVGDLMMAREIKSAILVTSPYHQRRASILFERQLAGTGVEFHNYPADDPEWDPNLWWTEEPSRSRTLYELAKLVVEVLSTLFR